MAQFSKYQKSASLLSNCQTFMPSAERMLSRAHQMFASRAYTHQYTQQGMTLADFDVAFATVENTLAHYQAL